MSKTSLAIFLPIAILLLDPIVKAAVFALPDLINIFELLVLIKPSFNEEPTVLEVSLTTPNSK